MCSSVLQYLLWNSNLRCYQALEFNLSYISYDLFFGSVLYVQSVEGKLLQILRILTHD